MGRAGHHMFAGLALVVTLAAASAVAADTLKIGLMTTLSGPGAALGADIRDGFLLALKHKQGALGGMTTEVVQVDDLQKREVAVGIVKRLVQDDQVHMVTGILWSNLALAVMPTLAASKTFLVSPNAGPSQLAGAQCSAYFFNVAYQYDTLHEAIGQHLQDRGFTKAILLAPKSPAGKDATSGFKRYFKNGLAGEVYTAPGQLDFTAEIAALKAAAPDAVYALYPGEMAAAFIRQYEQAGLKASVPLFGPAFSLEQDVLRAAGDAAAGVRNAAPWAPDLDNAANRRFVADFQATYGRAPSLYAAQSYDAALLIDSAVAATEGDLADKDRLRMALETAGIDSVRGSFRFNVNHFPIQDMFLREVVKGPDGALTNQTVYTIFKEHEDAYAKDCRMK